VNPISSNTGRISLNQNKKHFRQTTELACASMGVKNTLINACTNFKLINVNDESIWAFGRWSNFPLSP